MKDVQYHPYIQRAMRELGRTSTQPLLPINRNTQFSAAKSGHRQDLNRSNSAATLDVRNQLARPSVSEQKRGSVNQNPKKLQGMTQNSPMLHPMPLVASNYQPCLQPV